VDTLTSIKKLFSAQIEQLKKSNEYNYKKFAILTKIDRNKADGSNIKNIYLTYKVGPSG